MRPVYIIIVNYKNWQDTTECLDAVFHSSFKGFSVIVVDNFSPNKSLEQLVSWIDKHNNNTSEINIGYKVYQREQIDDSIDPASLPRLTFIQNDTNGGFAAGNNIALRLLKNRDAYFWLLNPDIIAQENTLAELARFANQLPTDAIIGGVIRSLSGNHELLFYGGATINVMTSTITPTREISSDPALDYIHGACLFAHTTLLNKAGLMPEEYFLYWEESDWCFRARRQGCTLHVCSTAVCFDKISTTIGRGFMADYYYVRNGLLFISKYKKGNLPVVVFFNMLRFFKRVVTGQWKKAAGVWRGTIDFFKMKRDESK